MATRSLYPFSAFLCSTLLLISGCSSDVPPEYADLVLQESVAVEGSVVQAQDAIQIIEAFDYAALRDSVAERFVEGIQLRSVVYRLDTAGVSTIADSTIITVGGEQTGSDSGINWLRRLLPEQEVFGALRNAEMFEYRLSDLTENRTRTLLVTVVPGSSVTGGLRTIGFQYYEDTNSLERIVVRRDGGGLFFREISLLNMDFDVETDGRLRGLENTVVLNLPFRGATALRTVVSVIDGAG